MPGGELTPPQETTAAGTRPEYSIDHVRQVVMGQLVDLEPPVADEEIVAIHGLVNGLGTECPQEQTLRFGIIAATGRTGSSISMDPRGRRLNEALSSFRLG